MLIGAGVLFVVGIIGLVMWLSGGSSDVQSAPADGQYHSFDLQANQTMGLWTSNDGDMRCSLQDPSGNALDGNINITERQSGGYYLRATFQTAAAGTYQVGCEVATPSFKFTVAPADASLGGGGSGVGMVMALVGLLGGAGLLVAGLMTRNKAAQAMAGWPPMGAPSMGMGMGPEPNPYASPYGSPQAMPGAMPPMTAGGPPMPAAMPMTPPGYSPDNPMSGYPPAPYPAGPTSPQSPYPPTSPYGPPSGYQGM